MIWKYFLTNYPLSPRVLDGIILKVLFEWQNNRKRGTYRDPVEISTGYSICFPNGGNSKGCARPKTGTKNSIMVSHVSGIPIWDAVLPSGINGFQPRLLL